VNGIHKLAL